MRLTIHRGTHEIGGTCVEIQAEKTRIVLDLGLPLFDLRDKSRKFAYAGINKASSEKLFKDNVLPAIDGLYGFQPRKVDAVLLSHPHQDHYGLMKHLHSEMPVYLSDGAFKVLTVSDIFTPTQFGKHPVCTLNDSKKVSIGDIVVTPYLMDHSAFGAMAFLIEADGKKVFYTGDFRGHGRKGKLFEKFLKNPPVGVDALVMEGTLIGGGREEVRTECDLEKEIIEIAKKYQGLKFIYCSGQNIDRLVTFFRAAKQMNHLFITDLYVANILNEIKTGGLPYPDRKKFPKIKVLFTKHFMRKLLRNEMKNRFEVFRDFEVGPARISKLRGNAFIIFRDMSVPEIERAQIPGGSVLFYSFWQGYKKEESFQGMKLFSEKYGIEIVDVHTSGHAGLRDLKRMVHAIKPPKIYPVHTLHPERFKDHFGDVAEPLSDGQTITL